MSSTLTVLMYLLMMFGLPMGIPSLLAPWLLTQTAYLTRMLYQVILKQTDNNHTDIFLLALYLNNWVQGLCVFLQIILKK